MTNDTKQEAALLKARRQEAAIEKTKETILQRLQGNVDLLAQDQLEEMAKNVVLNQSSITKEIAKFKQQLQDEL